MANIDLKEKALPEVFMIGYAIQPFMFCFKDLQNTITFILCLQKFPNSVKNSQMCQNTNRIINAVKIK